MAMCRMEKRGCCEMGRKDKQDRYTPIAEIEVDDFRKIVISQRKERENDFTIGHKMKSFADGEEIWLFLSGGIHINGLPALKAFREAVDYVDDVFNGAGQESQLEAIQEPVDDHHDVWDSDDIDWRPSSIFE